MATRRKQESLNQLVLPTFTPVVRIPTTVLPGARAGEWTIKAGKPEVVEEELTAPEFAHEANLSLRYVNQLCDDGSIQSRRKSNRRKSHYLIPRSELARWEQVTKAERS